jgi:hypothetical protein
MSNFSVFGACGMILIAVSRRSSSPHRCRLVAGPSGCQGGQAPGKGNGTAPSPSMVSCVLQGGARGCCQLSSYHRRGVTHARHDARRRLRHLVLSGSMGARFPAVSPSSPPVFLDIHHSRAVLVSSNLSFITQHGHLS